VVSDWITDKKLTSTQALRSIRAVPQCSYEFLLSSAEYDLRLASYSYAWLRSFSTPTRGNFFLDYRLMRNLRLKCAVVYVSADTLVGTVDRECIEELLPPLSRSVSTAMPLSFPATGLSQNDHELLSTAYEAACHDLVTEHNFSTADLISAIDPMSKALLSLFRAGQSSPRILALYALSAALKADRKLTLAIRQSGERRIPTHDAAGLHGPANPQDRKSPVSAPAETGFLLRTFSNRM
jgi:hypothetical protein